VSPTTQPIVVAFDGSDEARAALAAAAALFPSRLLIVVSVWEAGLAFAFHAPGSAPAPAYALPTPEEVATIDRIERQQAVAVATEGARLATEAGARAQPLPMSDYRNVGETIVAVAEEHDAAAIVVGSRGFGAVKAKLLGSTSRRCLHEADRPVLVVRVPASSDLSR